MVKGLKKIVFWICSILIMLGLSPIGKGTEGSLSIQTKGKVKKSDEKIDGMDIGSLIDNANNQLDRLRKG